MVKLIALIFSFYLSLTSLWLHAATATVDRMTIQNNETFNLTLRVETNSPSDAPDLSVLEKDFRVLGNSQSSRHMYSNGRSQSWTEWHINLLPKRSGQLAIPAISVNNEKTSPITLTVNKASGKTAQNSAVFLETEIDNKRIYLDQQLLFTVRIFNRVELRNLSLSKPDIQNAHIKQLAQQSYQRLINGQSYQVTEVRYAIFPQQAGELLIPEMIFSAQQRFSRGLPIQRLSQQHQITVIEPPQASYDHPWLPAKSVKLNETWSDQPKQVSVGQSITRTVTVTAEGVRPEQLAPLQFADINGAKQYPDQGSSDTNDNTEGITTIRQDSVAIIPTQPGPLTLPALEVYWWDTEQDQLRSTTLPAKTIQVLPSATAPSPTLMTNTTATEPAVITSADNSQAIRWQIISMLLALGWISSLWRWRRFKQQTANIDSKKPINVTAVSEAKVLKTIERLCKEQDLASLRPALLEWAKCRWPEQQFQTLADITAKTEPALSKQLQLLDKALYSEQAGPAWQPATLWQVISQLAKHPKTLRKEKTNRLIPPLYTSGK